MGRGMDGIISEAKLIAGNLLPEKSKEKYFQIYDVFMKWKQEKGIDEQIFTEDVMLAYFNQLKEKNYKPSTLWCYHSMLRTSILRNHNIDINYGKLLTFLKKAGVGFVSKKSSVFQADEIRTFLGEAPDIDYLALKVITIFGIYGATRSDELTKVQVQDIKQHGDVFLITIPETNIVRKFTIENEYALYVKKYQSLRPSNMSTTRFFIKFQKGKCANQPIGKNKFHSAPQLVAEFLNLPEPHTYTGHSFRRTSATLLADAGGSMIMLKQLGGWRSDSSAQGYVQDSVTSKRKIGDLIEGQIDSSVKSRCMTTPTITSASGGGENYLSNKKRCIATSTITSSSVAQSPKKSTVTCSQSIVTVTASLDDVENVSPNSGDLRQQRFCSAYSKINKGFVFLFALTLTCQIISLGK